MRLARFPVRTADRAARAASSPVDQAPRSLPSVPQTLAEARALIQPQLRSAIDRLIPEVRRVAAYHLGFTDAQGRPMEADGGKAVRPALALLSTQAAGSPATAGVPGAIAVELVHNFSLLHDDVMDQDRERRHRPTVWALFGVGSAIIAGDALQNLAQALILERPTRDRVLAAAALADATDRMIAGQAQDLAFESRLDVSIEDCLAMEENKTGALLACASSIGAILAGADDALISSLASFGIHLGLAFQCIDDVLGIWGRPEVTGKPSANDLRQHKKTVPIVAALESGTGAGHRLAELLRNGPLTEDRVAEAVHLVEQAGGRDRAVGEAERNIALAKQALSRASSPPEIHSRFAELADFVTRRDF